MQITGGKASGIRIEVPKGLKVRPTSVRARKGLFDSLNNFNNLTVVDLFAGAGTLGLEAASRGAKQVYFVENSKKHCSFISRNMERIRKAGVIAEMIAVRSDVLSVHKSLPDLKSAIDIIFLDPPYDKFQYISEKICTDKSFAEWAENALLIWEIPSGKLKNFPFSFEKSLWKTEKQRKFGQVEFIFLK